MSDLFKISNQVFSKKLPIYFSHTFEKKHTEKIKKMAKNNIKILGWQNDGVIKNYYKQARALIVPAVDDFGLTMVEAMQQGTPVIAIKKGGAKEIVKEGISGEFFDAQTIEVLADGVRRFIEKENNYNREEIKKEAERFEKEIFKRELIELIEKEVGK